MPYYMQLADFFIGKPGPGSISEALAMNLPVIVERNAWTLPQERYNADWILYKQVGLVISSFRANVAALCNRALFEIPDMLDRIVAADPCYRMMNISARG